MKDCSDMELSVNLKQRLSGQRYLVVLDDMWDSKEWNDLMLCFPDDNVGSRIVITSRLADLPLHVHYQHPLRFLSEKESWDLLRYKVFLKESCPSSLIEIGAHIARKCQGLPLSIVVIAGILASDTTTKWWSQVAREMSSIASNAPEEYMETLVLSYHHLPDHLKPCFLYFAAFPEDYEIPAWKLILLWVAEGFITIQNAETNLEEVAASYLNDLISRSLVIISKRRSNGGIGSCVVHDALRELCIKIADEEKFLHQMPSYQHEITTTSLPRRFHCQDMKNLIWQLTRYSPPILQPMVETILCFNGSSTSFTNIGYPDGPLLNVSIFKSLRVMDLSSIGLSAIPSVLNTLLDLRYIALCIKAGYNHTNNSLCLYTSIGNLRHLETLIIDNRNINNIRVAPEIWRLCTLRHLILKGNITIECHLYYTRVFRLLNLQTLMHRTSIMDCEKILSMAPNLRKLSINAALYYSSWKLDIPYLKLLKDLTNLSLQNALTYEIPEEYSSPYRELNSADMFPKTLKKLTLVCTYLKWDEMQKIGMLPNLEVLKLQFKAFCGGHWETSDGGFPRLKHLAFKFIKIVRWSAYSEQFPNLQHLKLEGCHQLEEIPISIGDIYTLETIEMRNCNRAVVQSAHKIRRDQLNKGNDMLKISIFQS
ncbi:hypothetical protein AgCh_002881 [Apium graveolens]